jgi:hypothetical protein
MGPDEPILSCMTKRQARITELIDELESRAGSLAFYTPSFGYQAAVERGEIEQGEPLEIDCGNSGTTIRLLMGLLAGQGRLIEAANEMGERKDELIRLIQEEYDGP